MQRVIQISRRVLLFLGLCAPVLAQAPKPLQVVATVPDLADLTQRIGGALVEVRALATPAQNLHAVRVKPSHLVALSRADAFVQVGLSLEHAWVPGLLEVARNSRVQAGGAGFIDAGRGFPTIEVPVVLDRSQSVDVHPAGNPHINVSFEGGAHLAAEILAGLERLLPTHVEALRANHRAWRTEYEASLARWRATAEKLRAVDPAVLVVHTEYSYLLRDLCVRTLASLEPRPGMPPTPGHLAQVIEKAREAGVKVLLTAPWSNDRSAARVAESVSGVVVELPTMVGGGDTASWIGLVDGNVTRIARALGVEPVLPEK